MVFRSFGILSYVFLFFILLVDWFCDNGGVEVFMFILKNDEFINRKYVLKVFIGCTQINDYVRVFIVDYKGFGIFMKQFKSEDETVVGNFVFCFSYCIQIFKVCVVLFKIDIIKDFFVLVRDGKKFGF